MLDPAPQWYKGITVTRRFCHPTAHLYARFSLIGGFFFFYFFLFNPAGQVFVTASKQTKEGRVLVAEMDFKNPRPSQSCRPGAGLRCPLGSCQSCLCRLLMWPGGRRAESFREAQMAGSAFLKPHWGEGQLTVGMMGGVSVPFFSPSQLKPSNHLQQHQ